MIWAQASSRHLRLAEGPGGLVINLPSTLSCPSLAFHQPQAFYCSWPEQPRSVSVSQHQDLFDDSEGDWSEFTEGPRLAWNWGPGQALEPSVADPVEREDCGLRTVLMGTVGI